MNFKARLLIALLVLHAPGICCAQPQTPERPVTSSELPENAQGFIRGYLSPDLLPDSLALLPPPPEVGSPRALADEAAHRVAKAQRTQERLARAIADANLRFPRAAEAFTASLGIAISEQETPHLITMLRRSLTDAGRATYAAKNRYGRVRPFALYAEDSCTPDEEAKLRQDGAYPSGHAAIGWAWALLLTELAPERANAVLARGYDFGQSRVICGVHWQSDVDAGRLVGAAVVARLHSDPVFLAQLAESRKEIAAARAKAEAARANSNPPKEG